MLEEFHVVKYSFNEVCNSVKIPLNTKDQRMKRETVEIQQLIVLCMEIA